MLPTASAEHYRAQRQIMAAVLALARRVWGTQPPVSFDDWFDRHVELLVAAVTEAQRQAVAGADGYVADVLDELGTPVDPDARIVTEPLVSIASDGRELDSLMYGAVITTKNGVGSGLAVEDAWDLGMKALLLRVQTQVADAARSAVGLGIAARPRVGYVRMLNPPSCSRCAVLAGRFYRWNAGFNRHPGCDCRGIPCREDSADDLRTDPRAYFDSLSVEQQDEAFTKAGAQAIRDGADISQVVNASRGMSTAQVYGEELAITTEGVTRRGVAYDAMRRAGYARWDTDVRRGRYFQAKAPRLMPEAVYEIAEDRADALRLLRLYGYLDDAPSARPATPRVGGGRTSGTKGPEPAAGGGGGQPPTRPPTGGQAVAGDDEPRRGTVDRTQVPGGLKQHELDGADRIADLGRDVTFLPAKGYMKAADMLIDGVEWEMKSPVGGKNSIGQNIRKAAAQADRVVLDISQSPLDIEEILTLAEAAHRRYDVSAVWIIGRGVNHLIGGE